MVYYENRPSINEPFYLSYTKLVFNGYTMSNQWNSYTIYHDLPMTKSDF